MTPRLDLRQCTSLTMMETELKLTHFLFELAKSVKAAISAAMMNDFALVASANHMKRVSRFGGIERIQVGGSPS